MIIGRRWRVPTLAQVLDSAERLVWLHPGSVLVIIGLEPAVGSLADITAALDDAGVPIGGVLLLPPGSTIADIDVPHLVEQWSLSEPTSPPSRCVSDVQRVEVACPRCATLIPVAVTVGIAESEGELRAHAYADQVDIEQHGLTCRNV